MNLLIIERKDLPFDERLPREAMLSRLGATSFLIEGRRAEHLLSICKKKTGDTLKMGIEDGPVGLGEIVTIRDASLKVRPIQGTFEWKIPQDDISILLALPRPQMLKRILEKAATFGVQKLLLFKSARVEKSYFSSPLLKEENLREHLLLGLEQGGYTRLPEVLVFKLEREFLQWLGQRDIEDTEEKKCAYSLLLSAKATQTLADFSPQRPLQSYNFLIGPEGGFLPQEEERFYKLGFSGVKVANSTLRVESAFDFVMAQHSLLSLHRANTL